MAVQGPKVGSSAKAETGKASMKEAGKDLGLSTPFKMSQMIGKSIGGLISFLCTHSQLPSINGGHTDYYGSGKSDVYSMQTGDPNIKISGIVTARYSVTGYTSWYINYDYPYEDITDPNLIYLKDVTGVNLLYNGKTYYFRNVYNQWWTLYNENSDEFNQIYDDWSTKQGKKLDMTITKIFRK